MGPAFVIGTHDTKGAELRHVADLLRAAGMAVTSVDVSTSGVPSEAAHVLSRTQARHGFYGASSMERLPTETALVAQTRAFENALTKE